MKHSPVFIVTLAVVILMAALSGCTSTGSPPVASTPEVTSTPAPIPVVTTIQTTAPAAEPDMAAIADKEFDDAFEACYAENPVISDIATRQAFTSCVQDTPIPKGLCAVNFRSNVLKYTKDDDTSAGYSRVNSRIKLAQAAYSKNLSYNYLTEKNEACSQPAMSRPI